MANIQMQKTGAQAFVSAEILPASDLERSVGWLLRAGNRHL